jgi:uncharacterized protein (TIGR02646 family)
MRKQTRTAEPEVLANNAQKWNDDWADKVNNQGKTSKDFNWHQVGKTSVRDLVVPVLREMNQGHCCFCDCYGLEACSKEPVEHFRPKMKFPHLAFTWSNLYYICDRCNNSKLEQWDDQVSLIAPDEADYAFDSFFDFDHTNGQMRPSLLADVAKQERADLTIRFYDLDSSVRRRYRREEMRKWLKSDQTELDLHSYRDYLESDS